jgi:hypothetical protein
MMFLILLFLIQLLTAVTADPVCTSLTAQNCLLYPNSCHVSFNTNPLSCAAGAPTDNCGTRTNQTYCAAATSPHCLWDPYSNGILGANTGYCFLTLSQANLINPCSTWNIQGDIPYAACANHACQLDSTCLRCIDYGNATNICPDGGNTVITLISRANFSRPSVSALLDATGTVSIPFTVNLNDPIWNIFVIGEPVEGLQSRFSAASNCSSVGKVRAMTNGVPNPVTYAPGATALRTYFINWVNLYHNFNWNLSDSAGVALSQLYGNITIGPGELFTDVSLSSDQSALVFTYVKNLNDMYDQCRANGVTYLDTLDTRFYSYPITALFRNKQNTWSASTQTWAISYSQTGMISIATTNGLSYLFSTQLNEVVPIACSNGVANTKKLRMTFTLVYSNVQDNNIVVGPRYRTDILNRTSSSGLINCFGDTTVLVGTTTCLSTVCYTPVVQETRCRTLSNDGQALSLCKYASPADMLFDLGASHVSEGYPNSLNYLHNFFSSSQVCPKVRNDDSACHDASSQPAFIQAYIDINEFPTAFYSVPDLLIDVAILPTPNSMIADNVLFSTWTGVFNATNQLLSNPLYVLPGIGSLSRMAIGIQLHDLVPRTHITLNVLIDNNNITITPLNEVNAIIPGGKVLHWNDIQPYAVADPRLFVQQSCPLCPILATCVSYLGCDGFAIIPAHLQTLSPAQGYQVNITFRTTLPAPSQVQNRRRMLLSISDEGQYGVNIDGNHATSYRIMVINATWFAKDTTTVITVTAEAAAIISVTTVLFFLGLVAVIVIMCYRARPTKYREKRKGAVTKDDHRTQRV